MLVQSRFATLAKSPLWENRKAALMEPINGGFGPDFEGSWSEFEEDAATRLMTAGSPNSLFLHIRRTGAKRVTAAVVCNENSPHWVLLSWIACARIDFGSYTTELPSEHHNLV